MTSIEPSARVDRERALELVRRYGFNATAFQALEQGYHYFFHDGGTIAYVDTGVAWVVAGAPIAATPRIRPLLCEFLAVAERAGRRTCLFATEERFLLLAHGLVKSFRIGEQPVWDPARWPETVARRPSLREQLRRARAKRVQVREVQPAELRQPETQRAIEGVTRRWQATRPLAPMEFLVRLELFSFLEDRRCFVAEQEGRIVGVAGVVPVPARSGWFIEDLVRDPSAPNGTGELLIDGVMRWARARGCAWLTLGLAPLAGDVPPLLRMVRRSGGMLYDFTGLERFRAKLEPQHWMPIYLSYPAKQSSWRALLDSLEAFNLSLAR